MVDNSQTKILVGYLKSLGLSPEEAAIYVALAGHGTSTPLQLSRVTGINRTKVYRTIETLTQKKMVQHEVGEHTSRVSPADPERLAELVKKKQLMAAELAKGFPEAERALIQMGVAREAETKVKFYRGKAGIED